MESEDELEHGSKLVECIFPLEHISNYVRQLQYYADPFPNRSAFLLDIASNTLLNPEGFFRSHSRNDLSLHLGACMDNESWMSGELLFDVCDRVHALLQTEHHRWVGNVNRARIMARAQSIWQDQHVETLTFIVYGSNHFVTVQLQKLKPEQGMGSIKKTTRPLAQFEAYCYDSFVSGRENRLYYFDMFEASAPVKAIMSITGCTARDVKKRWTEVPIFQQDDSHQCGFVSFLLPCILY
jgi:hypothetical protein